MSPRPNRFCLPGLLALGFLRFLPYGKHLQRNRTLYSIASSLAVILVHTFSAFEVGVGIKTGVRESQTYQIPASRVTCTRFLAFSALRKADSR